MLAFKEYQKILIYLKFKKYKVPDDDVVNVFRLGLFPSATGLF